MSTSEDTQTDNNINNNNEIKKQQQNIDTEMNDIESSSTIINNNNNTPKIENENINIEDNNNIDNINNINNSDSNKVVDIENKENKQDKEMIDLDNIDNIDKENKDSNINSNQFNKNNSNNISTISKNSLTSEPTEINGYVNPGIVNNATNIDITQTNLDEPRDSRVIKSILKTMGVQAHDPRVVNQLLEFMYKYVYEVLQDSIIYSEHSGKTDIDVSDVRLSIQSRVNYQITTPPPRELLLAIAEEKNKTPLPQIPNRFGVFLPADEYCLTSPNYQVNPPKHVPQPVQPLVGNTQRGNYNKKLSEKQIPIKFGNTTIVQPPNLGNNTTTTAPPPILPLTTNVKPPAINKPPTLSMPPTLTSPPQLQTKTTAPPILGLGKSTSTIAPPTLSMPPSLSSPTTTTTTSPPTIPNIGNSTSTQNTKMDDFDDFDSEMKEEQSTNKIDNIETTTKTASPPAFSTNSSSPPTNIPPKPDYIDTTKEDEDKTSL